MDVGLTGALTGVVVTEGAGGKMVFVKVRETYDLHTVKNKMSVIAIHTPDSKIIKANFPGLLMQCKAYRPYSCDVRVACASVLPVDPLGVGLAEGDVAPEDLFNPILYKACSNFGMSQIEARISAFPNNIDAADVNGNCAVVDTDSFTDRADEFGVYYGLLSNAHEWRHANPQSGLEMNGLKPLVYEMLYSIGDNSSAQGQSANVPNIAQNGDAGISSGWSFKGNAKSMPMINCLCYTGSSGSREPGFQSQDGQTSLLPRNAEQNVPAPKIVCGCIIIPPSRLHELFYRMVVEWTLEFSMIRPLSEITNWNGLETLASLTHYQNYDYSATKKVLTGDEESVFDSDTSLASANVDIKKVM